MDEQVVRHGQREAGLADAERQVVVEEADAEPLVEPADRKANSSQGTLLWRQSQWTQ